MCMLNEYLKIIGIQEQYFIFGVSVVLDVFMVE